MMNIFGLLTVLTVQLGIITFLNIASIIEEKKVLYVECWFPAIQWFVQINITRPIYV